MIIYEEFETKPPMDILPQYNPKSVNGLPQFKPKVTLETFFQISASGPSLFLAAQIK